MTRGLRLFVEGVGLLGPGLPSWTASLPTLRGEAAHVFAMTVLAPPARLPPAERRRSGPAIRLAMGVADEAVAHAGVDPQTLASVFTSSGGEGANCHSLCETLASPDPLISPTRFTNSVHNAAAGYWHIAVASRAASTSLCAYDGSFGAGLIEAASQIHGHGQPLLLVAYDLPYPEPLNAKRPLVDNFGLALVLTPAATPRTLARLEIGIVSRPGPGDTNDAGTESASACSDASLEALRRGIPAAAALPLLQSLACGGGNDGTRARPHDLLLDYLPRLRLRVGVDCGAGSRILSVMAKPAFATATPEPRLDMTPAALTLSHDGIAALIPHAGAMCLLAAMDHWDGQRIVCTATSHREPGNPLRSRIGLLAPCAIEYAAQAMALHGALIATGRGGGASPGFLASVRGVALHRLRLDDLPGELHIEADRQAGDTTRILYRFSVSHHGEAIASGRAAVVLNTPLASASERHIPRTPSP